MRYYKYLYLQENLRKKRERLIEKLESNRFQPGIHLIILAGNKKNHLEILNTALFLQKDYPREDCLVVGIAKGYDSAVEIVEEIVQEVYNKTGGTDIRSYILDREQES